MSWSDTERAEMAESFREHGPDVPTLCEGWRSRHLLAHLVLRQDRPWAIAADTLARRPPGQEPRLAELAAQAGSADGFAALVDRLAAGAPGFRPVAATGDRGNLLEMVVHHEDLRRGAGPADARVLPTDLLRSIWRHALPMAKMLYRSSPVGVVLVVPGGPRALVRRRADAVAVEGDPVELVLHAFGRRTAAEVQLLGRPATVARFQEWASA